MGKKKPYLSGIQDTVLEVIKEHILMGNSYIERRLIDEEMSNTSIGDWIDEHYKRDEKDVMRRKIDQALRQLKKKGEIKHFRGKKGRWTLAKSTYKKKHKPKICKALQKEYEIYCKNCGAYTYMKKKEKRCPNCGSDEIRKRVFRHYCPIKKKYIAEPKEMCSIKIETDYELVYNPNLSEGQAIQHVPMEVCFCRRKPNDELIDVKTKLHKTLLEKENQIIRHYSHNPNDPLSKQYISDGDINE